MGGKALTQVYTRRYSREEFYLLYDELKPKLQKAFNTQTALVISYKTKSSFGDMDILLLNSGNTPTPDEINKILIEEFGASQIARNSTIYSFDYKQLQIDLIFTPTSNWETSKTFFSYNDLGNLLGKIYHKLGLSFGFSGLRFIYRTNEDRILEEFIITKDFKKILEFIGLSYERYLEGFDTMIDIYDYIISSKYFEPTSFYLENLDQKNRKRNAKRANYAAFIEYIEELFGKDDKDRSKKYRYDKHKSKYYPIIHEYFKDEIDFLDTLKRLDIKEERRKIIVSKYNGNIIMQYIPELSGYTLGHFIKDHDLYIKINHNTTLKDLIFTMEHRQIKELILTYYETWKNIQN